MRNAAGAMLDIQDIPRLFSRYRWLVIGTTVLSVIAFTAASYVVPKKYKAHFVLTIYSKYFQSPLVGDFVPELSEGSAQRESLIRQVLTPEYLDYLGLHYALYYSPTAPASAWWTNFRGSLRHWLIGNGLYQPVGTDSRLSSDRQALLNRILVFEENSTTYNISFVASDPQIAYQVVQDIYGQVIKSLLELRMHTLANIRDAIQKRLESLTLDMASTAIVPRRAQHIREELDSVRGQLRALRTRYTDEHPLVQQLKEREAALTDRLQDSSADLPEPAAPGDKPATESTSAQSGREIYTDLTKKLNYLNIAIDSDREHQADYFATLETPMLPTTPIWPKTALFIIYGLASGLFGSLFMAALREYFARSALHADSVAQHLGLPLLGQLPPARWRRTPKSLLPLGSSKTFRRR